MIPSYVMTLVPTFWHWLFRPGRRGITLIGFPGGPQSLLIGDEVHLTLRGKMDITWKITRSLVDSVTRNGFVHAFSPAYPEFKFV